MSENFSTDDFPVAIVWIDEHNMDRCQWRSDRIFTHQST